MKLPNPAGDIIVQTFESGEAIIYTMAAGQVHHLNRHAMAVFQACRNGDTMEQLVDGLAATAGPSARDVANVALSMLERDGILESRESAAGGRVGRRDVMKALTAASLLPVVASVVAPLPAVAQSCVSSCAGIRAQPGGCPSCGTNCSSHCLTEYTYPPANATGVTECTSIGITGTSTCGFVIPDTAAGNACYNALYGSPLTNSCNSGDSFYQDVCRGYQGAGTKIQSACDSARRYAQASSGLCHYLCCQCSTAV